MKERLLNPQALLFKLLHTKPNSATKHYAKVVRLKKRPSRLSVLATQSSKFGIMLIGFILYRRNKNTQRQIIELQKINGALQTQYDVLKDTNDKNELLLNEIHHRVKNNLQFVSSLLNMKMRSSDNAEAKQALHESAVRLQSMLLVHQKLYSEDRQGFVDMKQYTHDLVHYLLQSYITNKHPILPHISVGTIKFETDTVIPFGLLLTELITNSIKYAKPKEQKLHLNIELSPLQHGQYCLHYSDNGKGLSSPIDFTSVNTMGLRLLYNLTKQLKGTIHYEFREISIFKINFRSI
ncbi:sensor histidine kinase [Olivibacter domesticus]|uniref:histidine kinase n=1 Tax=Olivibacter domesticus TaxID=407022 RepID=A0A1H7UPQ1_OLID1|nr:sensor histidine kinase [Olivibacter domesticus]SEL98992.1 Two-component sensor histidine kinase, contains HisKA and HATPase domains [Olivibacter domesticus]